MRAWYSLLLDLLIDTQRGPTVTPRPSVTIQDPAPSSGDAQPDGLETQRDTLRTEGFSDSVTETILQSTASSTMAGYNAKWNVFVRWCTARGVDSHSTSVTDISEFLQERLDQRVQWQTLRGYVAAISACHKGFTVQSLGKDRRIILFLKGSFANTLQSNRLFPLGA